MDFDFSATSRGARDPTVFPRLQPTVSSVLTRTCEITIFDCRRLQKSEFVCRERSRSAVSRRVNGPCQRARSRDPIARPPATAPADHRIIGQALLTLPATGMRAAEPVAAIAESHVTRDMACAYPDELVSHTEDRAHVEAGEVGSRCGAACNPDGWLRSDEVSRAQGVSDDARLPVRESEALKLDVRPRCRRNGVLPVHGYRDGCRAAPEPRRHLRTEARSHARDSRSPPSARRTQTTSSASQQVQEASAQVHVPVG